MKKVLIVTATGLVENFIEYDPAGDYDPGPGRSLVDLLSGAEIGGTWNGTSFDPKPPIDPGVLDAIRDGQAQQKVDDAVHKVVRDLFFDVERRLRALGADSFEADIAAATNLAEYTAALKARVKAEL